MPLRPLVKLLSALFLRLPPFSRATGDGFQALPSAADAAYAGGYGGVGGSGGSSGAGGLAAGDAARGGAAASVSDPVAERRRERALRALDRKLAELRTNGRGGGGPALLAMPPTPLEVVQTPAGTIAV